MSLEDLTVAAGELSECTGHVTYCNFTLRPLRARYVVKNDTYQEETPITYYPHVKRDGGIEYALVSAYILHTFLLPPSSFTYNAIRVFFYGITVAGLEPLASQVTSAAACQ
jgi:hypothetical protein